MRPSRTYFFDCSALQRTQVVCGVIARIAHRLWGAVVMVHIVRANRCCFQSHQSVPGLADSGTLLRGSVSTSTLRPYLKKEGIAPVDSNHVCDHWVTI